MRGPDFNQLGKPLVNHHLDLMMAFSSPKQSIRDQDQIVETRVWQQAPVGP
jgi:hypothetical protein